MVVERLTALFAAFLVVEVVEVVVLPFSPVNVLVVSPAHAGVASSRPAITVQILSFINPLTVFGKLKYDLA